MKKTNLITPLFLLTTTIFFSFSLLYQSSEWKVPEAAKKMKNPVKADNEVIAIGKTLYAKHCRSCHGKNGEGDGPKSEELETFPGDFTTDEFHAQTDGALYYKTTEGRDDMPEFKKKVPEDEDRWILVHYLRTFKN